MKEDTESFNCGDEIILILQRLVVTGEREWIGVFSFGTVLVLAKRELLLMD